MSETPAQKTAATKAPAAKTAAKKAPATKKTTPAKKTAAKKTTPAKKTAARKTTTTKAPAKRTAARKTATKKTTPSAPKPIAQPIAKAARRSPAERAVDVGAQALSTAALIQKVAHETAERVAAETAARVSQQYEAAISELTKNLDKNTKRALKSVRTAADLAQAASPLKGKKKK